VPAVESFTRKLAVVTGGGSGMGRELARQLAAAGCSVAACDWHQEEIAQAAAAARAGAVDGRLRLRRTVPHGTAPASPEPGRT
jgi:NAD(P)-dependent dehydrogenase (short-subunit alcohol dehydrogenase family)